MASFNERLRSLMDQKGIRAAELARKTGLTKPTLGSLLRGETTDPRASSLFAIAKALGCDPIWLFLGRNSAEYNESTNIQRVPIWTLKEMAGHLHGALPLVDTGRFLLSERDGHLCAVEANNDALSSGNIRAGDICIIDMAQKKLHDGNVVLVDFNDRFMLLRATETLEGILLGVDDRVFGHIKEKDALVLGKMVEWRRMHST